MSCPRSHFGGYCAGVEHSYLSEFWFSKYIISDNATSFSSHSFRNFCFSHGIRHNTLSPYHPQPSLAERCNRNLKASLIAFHSQNQSSWDESLPWLQTAFNSAKHESTGRTPFEVIFKFAPSTPLSCSWDIQSLLPEAAEDTQVVWQSVNSHLMKATAVLQAHTIGIVRLVISK